MLEIWLEFEHTSECRFSSEYFRKANSHAVKWDEVKWLSGQHFPFYSLCWKDIELLVYFIFITSAVWWKKKKPSRSLTGCNTDSSCSSLPPSLSVYLTHALSLFLTQTISLSFPCLFPYTGIEGGGGKRTSGHPNLGDSLRKKGEEVRPQC